MKGRLARFLWDREEHGRWIPEFLARWAFDYLLDHGTPVTFGQFTSVPWSTTFEINPAPKTWASGTAQNITFTLSPDHPYR